MYNSNVSGYNSFMDIFGMNKPGKSNSSSDIFNIGGSFREMLANKSGMQDMLNGLAERFSSANVTKGKPESGVEGTEKYFGKGKGDHAAIDENLLAAMFGNGDLAKQVESALENFFNTASAPAMEGAYTQRSISISITVVRMNVSQRAEGSGDLLSSQEMQTAFQEQLQNLINKFFGIDPANGAGLDVDAVEGDGDAALDETKKDNNGKGKAKGHDKDKDKDNGKTDGAGQNAAYGAAGFSFSMFFSSNMLSWKGQNSDGSANGGQSMFGMQAGMSFSAFGNFQDFANGSLPDILGQFFGQGKQGSGGGNGPFTSMLGGAFGQFGMSMNSFEMNASGVSISGSESKDMISQMFEYLLGGRGRPDVAGATGYEADGATEAEGVAEVAEEALAG